MMQKWQIEVIRYDSKGKKTVEIDIIEAEAYRVDDHNNLILHYIARISVSPEQALVIKMYHAYNWISISPVEEDE